MTNFCKVHEYLHLWQPVGRGGTASAIHTMILEGGALKKASSRITSTRRPQLEWDQPSTKVVTMKWTQGGREIKSVVPWEREFLVRSREIAKSSFLQSDLE